MLVDKKTGAALAANMAEAEVKGRSLWQDAWLRFRRNKAALSSMFILLLIAAWVLIVPTLTPFDYSHTDWANMHTAPSFDNKHYFGTDSLGRDLLTRVSIGGRISLMVGVAGALVAVLIGTVYGAVSGYMGGKTDMLMMRF
ncbi:MAG: peptide ABC transporter permease, partial [Conchiformibius sp.]|nr:peptide ABC transporter permease [Conchiformibius sp.]